MANLDLVEAVVKYITIDGKRYLWRDLVKLRREQHKGSQLLLFELKEDSRPETQRFAHGRYREPTLFDS
jgi:hypothetical protein